MDMLNKLYNCSSYSGANKYRANATVVQVIDLPKEVTRSFLQYQAVWQEQTFLSINFNSAWIYLSWSPCSSLASQLSREKMILGFVTH